MTISLCAEYRILHVIASMNPKWGGVCQAVRTTIRGLEENSSIKNEVVSLDATDSSFQQNDPFPSHYIGPSKGPWAYSARLLPWLVENLPRFDVIIIHGLWQYHGYAVRKAVRVLESKIQNSKSTIPRIYVMPHGMLDPYFQREQSRRLKALRNVIYWKLIEHKVVNQAYGMLFTCEEERLLARETFKPYQPKKVFVVGLGVEQPPAQNDAMQQVFYQACPELNGQPYLLFLSRIHPKKGVDLLIRAYAELATSFALNPQSTINHPQSRFPSLVIAGPLDSAYAAEMQALAEQLLPSTLKTENCMLAPSILFPGMLRGDAKWGAFHGCEAFILPSHQENFGIAVVEALACGKAVLISSKVNIWREIVESGAGRAEDDSIEGTMALLRWWMHVGYADHVSMTDSTRCCYADNFSIEQAAMRLATTISLNP
jgi:glycosyltransferase involved in cell wall biosynthesis